MIPFYLTIDYSVPVVCKMDISSGNLHFASVFMFITRSFHKGAPCPQSPERTPKSSHLILKYPNNNLHLWECMRLCVLILVWLFATLWTVAHQAPLPMGFSKQEYWSGLPFPPPRDLYNPGIEPRSPAFPALAGGFFTTEPPGKPPYTTNICGHYE